MRIVFTKQAEKQLRYWLKNDKKKHTRIIELIEAILENPYSGIGKPEALKHNLSGYWSRRIDLENRLVYIIENNELIIIQCKYHY